MFSLWMLYIIFTIISIIVEILVPTLFCINFAIAGVITSIIAYIYPNLYISMIIFFILSLFSILFIKPILERYLKKGANADFNEQYIGKTVKVIEPISCTSGAVSIYDERWEARIKDENKTIEAGCNVKIIANESLILYVEKL